MRKEDRLELERFYEESPEAVLRQSFEQSEITWAAYRPDNLPVAIWGVAKAGEPEELRHVGIPWMIGTDFIKECYRDFLFFSRHFDFLMGRKFDMLINAIDAEYAGARRWLRWLGYEEGFTMKSVKNFEFIVMVKATRDVR